MRRLAIFLLITFPLLANTKHAPLPKKLLSAKTVFVENHGSARLNDRTYAALKKWGRFEIVDDRARADVILSLSEDSSQSTRSQTWDQKANKGYGAMIYGDSTTVGDIHFALLDAKTAEPLYSDVCSTIRMAMKNLRKRLESK